MPGMLHYGRKAVEDYVALLSRCGRRSDERLRSPKEVITERGV